MTRVPELRTGRLWLRAWRDEDLAPFAVMNADPAVVEFLPGALSRAESDALAERIRAHFDRHGFGLWAVEVASTGRFAGCIGLSIPAFEAAFTPCVEVGWRLARPFWGAGYATEGAHAVLAFGFEEVGLDEIVAFTVFANRRSRAVMERIGMRRDAGGDFDHPALPAGHRLRRHVLYRLRRDEWTPYP